MSTRSTRFYRTWIHIYDEFQDGWVHLELGHWLNLRLYKRPREFSSEWLGRLACWTNHHTWFLETIHPITTYRCQRFHCRRLSNLTHV